MILHIFRIFLLLIPTVFVEGFLDTELLKDITWNFTSHYSGTCIKILHPYNHIGGHAFRNYFKVLKKLAEHPRWTIGFYSYEEYLQLRSKSEYRGYCPKPLKATIADKASKDGFAKMTYDYPMSNSLWLILLKNVTIEEYFEGAKLPFDTQIITASIRNSDLVDFHEIYRVGIGFPMRIIHFGNWTRSKGMNVYNDNIYERRTDLEGKLFRAGYVTQNWPLTYINSSNKLDGYFPKIWFELAELMNVTTEYKPSTDLSMGREKSDGNWTGLMGMLLEKEIDIIVADLTISGDRWRVIDFLEPILTSRYQIYYRHLGNNLEWTAVFRPFAVNVWLSIIGYILVASVSLALCDYICLLYGMENYAFIHFGPTESFFFVLQSLCQQGYAKVPKRTSSRVIFLMSYLVSAILIPSYSASLISSLANQTPIKPFDSLKEMVKDESYKLIIGRNTAEFALFSKATNGTYKDAYEKLIKNVPRMHGVNLNTSVGKEYMILCEWNRYALFGTEITMRIKISNQTFCRVTSFTRSISEVHQSFGIRKNSPYAGLINYHLNRMISGGLIKRIQRNTLQLHDENTRPTYYGVELEEIFHYFVFLSVGIIATTMVLFYEKIQSKRKVDLDQRKKRKELEMFKNYQTYYGSYLE